MDERTPEVSFSLVATRALKERSIHLLLAACAGATILLTLGLAYTLLSETVSFFSQVSLVEFLTDTRWTPLFREKHFGILPLVSASVMVAAGAGLVAIPLGLLTAVFVGEYAGPRLRRIMKSALAVTAAVPTVVFGYFALTLVTPGLRVVFPGIGVFNALSASLVVGIMILPTVASLSQDALRAVPGSLREAAMGLGATRMEAATRVVIPAAAPGISASFLLALSRALGETIIVTLAAGSSPQLSLNPLESVQTLTAYILQVGTGDTSPGTLEFRTLFAVGTTLLVMTMALNLAGLWIRSRVERGAPWVVE